MIRIVMYRLGSIFLADNLDVRRRQLDQRLQDYSQRLQGTSHAEHIDKVTSDTDPTPLDKASEVSQARKALEDLRKDRSALQHSGLREGDVEATLGELDQLRASLHLERAELLFTAYMRQSQHALDAIYRDGYADFIDTFGGTERIRPPDAADAILRLNVAVWTVTRDIRSGAISPRDFGLNNWEQVDARAMYNLAVKRIEDDVIDHDKEVKSMQGNPLWRRQPIMIHDPGNEPAELKPGNFSGFWRRSIYSAVAPNEATESFEALQFARIMRDGAIAVANRTGSEAAASVNTAYAFFKGRGIAANAGQALAAITEAAGINIVSRFDAARAGTTREQLEEQQKEGKIDGFLPLPGGGGYMTYRLKSVEQIAREVQTKLKDGRLAHLPADTRRALEEMIGPPGSPGSTLKQRLDSEDSGRWWRQFGSEVVQVAAIGLASGGVGAIAEGAAFAAGAGRFAIGAARLVATSVSFTTMMGAVQGHIDPVRYPIDLAMFGVLGAAGRFTKLAGRLIPGSSTGARIGQLLVAHGATVVGAGTVLTGFTALEQAARQGKFPGWDNLASQFGRNLAMVATLHGVNMGLAGLGIAPDSPVGEKHRQLVDRALQADAKVQNTLTELAEVTAAAEQAAGAERTKLVERAAELMKQFDTQCQEIDRLRGDLLQFAERYLSPEQIADIRRAFGEVNPDVNRAQPMTPPQSAALQTFLTRFQNFSQLGLDPGVVESGVRGLSQRTLLALSEPFRSPYGSVDPQGAANVDHLASVFRGVLKDAAVRKGAPLTQAEVNRLAMETILTDAWMKGQSPQNLQTVPTAPTRAGQRTGGEIQAQLKARAKQNIAQGGPISDPVKNLIHAWIDRAFIPMSLDAIRAEAQKAGLNAEQTTELVDVWGKRIMGSGNWATAQGFMLGVWLHGMPGFELVRNVVRSAGMDSASAQQVYEAVLGHHMAGFIANGFSKGDLRLDFQAMEHDGQLPRGGAARLEQLYDTAIELAGKWRSRIDGATRMGQGLTPAERAEYARDAEPFRRAVEQLPESVRSQLFNDDAQQFTEIGLPKWLTMQKGMLSASATNADLIKKVYGEPVQAYYEENLARGSGGPFERGTATVANRLGVTLDPASKVWRPAQPGEAAHTQLARQIAQDAPLQRALLNAKGLPANLTAQQLLERLSPQQIVDWFNGQPVDVTALVRLAGAPAR